MYLESSVIINWPYQEGTKKITEITVKVQVKYVESFVESVFQELEKYREGTIKGTSNFRKITGKFKAITGSREIPGKYLEST